MNRLDAIFNFKDYEDDIALISCDTVVSYSEMDNISLSISSEIRKRSLVFLICTNTIDSIIAYVGIVKSGAICVLIKERNFNFLFETYRPEYVVAPTDILQIEGEAICNINNYTLYKTNCIIDYEINDDVAILLSTSGSTGSPKFVKISYDNIISNTVSITEYLNISSIDRAITTMPMNYSYGLSIIHTHLANGASIIVTDASLMSRELWDLMKNKDATNFGGVPYTYQMLKKLRFERMNLPSLKCVTQAGGKLDKKLIVEFHDICKQKSINFFVMYGQTEATARMAYLPMTSLPERAGSIGSSIPNGKFVIEDDSNNVIESNETEGELVYYGQNVSIGYSHNCYDLNETDSNNGCLHTGDLAKRDSDGYYYIVGRINRFIKVFGNRVNLDEFEKIVGNYGFECVCTGQEDKINIYVTDSSIDKTSFINNLMSDTGLNKSAFNIVNIDSVPRSDSGKILYSEIEC